MDMKNTFLDKVVVTLADTWDPRVPPPRMGGAFAYCPHVTTEVIKVPKKRAKTVHTNCKFKTRNLRRYRRHWIRQHEERIIEPQDTSVLAPPPADPAPKYPEGDVRRRK